MIEKRDKFTLANIVANNIGPNTVVQSDGWKGYLGLTNHGITHQTVNHSLHFKDPITGVHTNTIEGTWSEVKLNIPNRCRTKKLINPFLVRYMIKKNEKGNVFKYLIKQLF